MNYDHEAATSLLAAEILRECLVGRGDLVGFTLPAAALVPTRLLTALKDRHSYEIKKALDEARQHSASIVTPGYFGPQGAGVTKEEHQKAVDAALKGLSREVAQLGTNLRDAALNAIRRAEAAHKTLSPGAPDAPSHVFINVQVSVEPLGRYANVDGTWWTYGHAIDVLFVR